MEAAIVLARVLASTVSVVRCTVVSRHRLSVLNRSWVRAMNLLMVGANKAPGSWDMRGLQLGAVLGARTTSMPTRADWKWADCAVLVKHAGPRWAAEAHRLDVPIVWDALDFWPQPGCNGFVEADARRLLRQTIETIQPALVIGATQAMAEAAGGVYVPHHSWSGLAPTPAREGALTVAYQGNAAFIGTWAHAITRACERRGWTALMNPADIWTADILVAFRDAQWDGWMCRQWKSGVKLVNAIAAGRPVITQDTAAARELGAPGAIVETPADLDDALDAWTPVEARAAAVEECRTLAPVYTVAAVAAQYRVFLERLSVEAPCSVA